MKKIVAISGSLRAASANTALLRAAVMLAPADLAVTLFEGIGGLPHFNPDCESDPPPAVVAWRDVLIGCDAIMIASPEYAHGVAGAFKNALDWVVGCAELGSKPVALVNTSVRAVHAHAALAEIVGTMGWTVVQAASIVIPVANRGYDAEAISNDAQFAGLIVGALQALAGSAGDELTMS